jgi:hypothetical protein
LVVDGVEDVVVVDLLAGAGGSALLLSDVL